MVSKLEVIEVINEQHCGQTALKKVYLCSNKNVVSLVSEICFTM